MEPPDKMDAVKVAVRIRPILQKELQNGRMCMWETKDQSINQKDEIQPIYTFDGVYDENCTTYELYDEISSPIVKAAMTGIHGTVFAYGQSGSGKTFTMSGDSMAPGLIKQAATEIFDYVDDCPNREFLLRMCYMEIYQEKICDLLSTDKDKLIKIQEDKDHQINVVGLHEEHVTRLDQVFEVIKEGDSRRKTAETKQNDRSSRSHSILRMIIESRETGEDNAVMLSHLNFVDLAGSEKAGDNSGDRLKEGCAINKSLLILSQVIFKLSEGDGEGYIGYRDSKVTRILQNALGGNSKTAIICTISPTSIEESHSTLKFASNAKKIKNKPHVNEVLNGDALLKKYRMEIQRLQKSASEMGVIDMQMEKNELERKLKEKEDIQCEQKRLIESLQRLICTSNPNPEESKIEIQKKKLRRETWAGPKFQNRRISHFPTEHFGGTSFAPSLDGNSLLLPNEMDFSSMDSIRETSIFSTFSDKSMVSTRNPVDDLETDREKAAMKLKLIELERMLDELNKQYYDKVDELEELRQFTTFEKNITDSDIAEKVQAATEKIKSDLDQQNQYITQVEAELYKVVATKTELSQQLTAKKDDLTKLQLKIDKLNRESDKQDKTNQDYITMLERQVEQTEAKLQNVDKMRHSTGQMLTNDKKLGDEKEKKSLKEEISRLQSQLEEKNYEIDTLKMDNMELSKHREKAREYRVKLQEMEDSKESNGLDDFESAEVIVGLKTKIEELEAELELKNEALNNIDLAAETFTSANPELETRVTSLEEELSVQKDLVLEKLKALETLKSEFDENNYLLTQKDEAFNFLQAELDETKEMLAQTHKSSIELEDGIEKFNIEIESLKSELTEKNQALEAIDLDTIAAANVESQIAKFQAEIENLEKKLEEKKIETENLNAECVTIKQEMSSQIHRLTEELEVKRSEINIVPGNTNEVDKLQSSIQELKQELQETKNVLKTKTQHIETLESMSNVSFTEELGVPQSAWRQPLSPGKSLQDELMQAPTSSGMSLQDELMQAPISSGMSLQDELMQVPTGSGMSLQDELMQAPTGSGMSLQDELNQAPTGSGMSLQDATVMSSHQDEVLHSRILELEEQLKETSTKLSELSSPSDLQKEEESCLKDQINNLQEKLGQRSIEMDTMKTNTEQQISMKDTEIQHLNSKLALVQAQNVEEITDKLTEKETEVSELQQQLLDLENKLQNMVEVGSAKICDLQKQVEELQNNLEFKENEMTKALCNLDKAPQQLESANENFSLVDAELRTVTELNNQIEDLQSLLESKEMEITDLHGKIEDSHKSQEDGSERRQSFETGNMSGQFQELRKFFEAECTPSKRIRRDSNQAQKAGLEAKLEEANDQVQELKSLVESKEVLVNDLTKQLEESKELFEDMSSVNDKVTEYEKQLQNKDQTILSLQETDKKVLKLEEEQVALKEKMTLMEEELQMKSETLTDTLSKVTELENQIEALQNEVGDLEAIVDKETNENTENKDKIIALQEEISMYRTEIEKLNDQIKELNSTCQKSSHDYQKLQEDHTELQSWYQKQQEAEVLRAEGKDAKSLLKEQLTELREEFNLKRDEMDKLEVNLNEQLNVKQSELESLQKEMEAISTEHKTDKENKSTLEKEITVLREKLAVRNEEMSKIESDHNETISSKDEELINLQTELEELKREIESELTVLLAEKSDLEHKVQNHEEILAIKQSETTALQEELTEAQSSISEKEMCIKTLEVEIIENRDILMEEISKLQTSVEDKDAMVSNLKLEHVESIRKLEEQLAGLEEIKQNNSEHLEKEDLLKLQIDSLREQLSSSENAQEQMKIQTEEHSEKEVVLKKQIESLHEQLSSKSDLHEQILKIREEHSRTENNLLEQVTELKSLLLKDETKITSLIDECKGLQTKVNTLETEISEVESISKKEKSRLGEELDELKSQLLVKESQIETLDNDLKQTTTDLNKQIQTLESDIEERDGTISQLQEELSKSCNKVTELQQENLNCTLIESPGTDAELRINELIHEKADIENRLEELQKKNSLKLEEMEQHNKTFVLEMKKQRFLLRTQVTELTKERDRFERGFNLYRGRCNDVVTDYKALKDEKETWDEELAEKQAKWSGLEKKAINLNLENHQLKTEMEKQSTEYEKKFTGLNETIEYKEDVIIRLKDQLRRQTTDLDNTTCESVPTVKAGEYCSIEVSSKDKIVDIFTLRIIEAENSTLKSQLDTMNVKFKDLTDEKEKLHQRVQIYKQKIKELSTGKPVTEALCDKENVKSPKKQKFSANELEETVCSPDESFNFDFRSPARPLIPVSKKEEEVTKRTGPLKGISLSPSQCPTQ